MTVGKDTVGGTSGNVSWQQGLSGYGMISPEKCRKSCRSSQLEGSLDKNPEGYSPKDLPCSWGGK